MGRPVSCRGRARSFSRRVSTSAWRSGAGPEITWSNASFATTRTNRRPAQPAGRRSVRTLSGLPRNRPRTAGRSGVAAGTAGLDRYSGTSPGADLRLGTFPDWWKLQATLPEAWAAVAAVVEGRDPPAAGYWFSTLDASAETLRRNFLAVADLPVVRFAVGGRYSANPAATGWRENRRRGPGRCGGCRLPVIALWRCRQP